jgi:hypothetical protein
MYDDTVSVTAHCDRCGHRGAMHQIGAPVGERRCLATGCTCTDMTVTTPTRRR